MLRPAPVAGSKSPPPSMVVFVDSENRVIGTGHDPAEALPSQEGLLPGNVVYPDFH